MKATPDQLTRSAQHLLLVGGILTLVLAPLLLLLRTPVQDIQLNALTGEVTTVILAVILIIAARQAKESPLTAILLGLVASIALLLLGGTPGLVGGLFGIVGGLVASVPYVQSLVTWES
ncbi:MAG: hypothetical protein ACE5LS_04585 [Thermoplasmata archaeon]